MRSSIPKNIITELRIVIRIIRETFKGFKQTGFMNIVIITTMAAILSIFGCLFRTSLGLNKFIDEMGNVLEISVYLKPQANAQKVVQSVRKIPHVQRIKLIKKERAWGDLKKQMTLPRIDNPLPDTLHVKISKQQYLNDAAKSLKKLKEVEDIRYAQDLAQKMRAVHDISSSVTFVTILLLGGLTMFIISNTIQLVIQSRKQEIEIMRLMGVNNWYIKAPYIIQGAFYGFTGAILSLIPLNILQVYLEKAHSFFGVPSPIMATNIVVLSLLTIGIVFGAGGSVISIKRFIKV